MDWITRDFVKNEALKGEMPSLECSKLHHNQGATCTRGELIDAMGDGRFSRSPEWCACCEKYGLCNDLCPLSKDGSYGQCCGGTFRSMGKKQDEFVKNPTPANFATFQTAEKAVVKYIQAVIDKKKKPEFDYSKSIVATKNSEMYLLVPTRRPESYEIVGYDWLNLKTGQANSCSCWKTQRKAIDCYSDHVIKNVDLAIIGDNAKQAKVGEKSEQGKSEKAKDEPELRHLDYGLDKHGQLAIHIDILRPIHKGPLTVYEKGWNYANTCGQEIKTKLGNLIDDLTETSEGFEMRLYSGRVKVCPTNNGRDLVIRRMNEHDNYTSIVRHEDLAEFHRKLGHVLNGIRS